MLRQKKVTKLFRELKSLRWQKNNAIRRIALKEQELISLREEKNKKEKGWVMFLL